MSAKDFIGYALGFVFLGICCFVSIALVAMVRDILSKGDDE